MCKTTVIANSHTHQTNTDRQKTNPGFQKQSFRYFLIFVPFLLILLISTSYQQNPEDLRFLKKDQVSQEISDSLKKYLFSDVPFNLDAFNNNAYALNFVRDFYAHEGYKPVWINLNGVSTRGQEMINLIVHAREYGLEPSGYFLNDIRRMLDDMRQDSRKQEIMIDFNLEVVLTHAALKLMINLHAGYLTPDSALFSSAWIQKLPLILLQGIENDELTQAIHSVEPDFIEYRKLRAAGAQYVKSNHLSEDQVDIQFPNKDSVVLTTQVVKALINLGYLKSGMNSKSELKEAIRSFQQYHGLTPDGKLGYNTIEALETSTLYHFRLLALNLDRLRKSADLSRHMLYVNIPSYSLKIFEQNNLMDTFRVIVGNPETPTPLWTGQMDRVIANPVWYVPRSIAVNEMLPKIKADSNYLEKNGFKILDKNYREVDHRNINLAELNGAGFDYTFRQSRGSDNSLGQVKFIFTNPYSVYLHDTPGKSLFEKDLRAFSHGCVRVQHPERLASYLINKINADTTDFAGLLKSGQQRDFKIESPVSIVITYITCEADNNGMLYFYKDIYGLDNKELEAVMLLADI